MSVKIVDVVYENGVNRGLQLTNEGRVFFNQFRPNEELRFVSFIGAGRVGKSWLASRFAEDIWCETVRQSEKKIQNSAGQESGQREQNSTLARTRAEVPVPWSGDIFYTRGEGESVTKGIWAFALRAEDQEEDDHKGSDTEEEQPPATTIILDCEGSDNLLDTREENTVAKQIQAISFFLAGRGTVVYVETDRLRTQSLDDFARILDLKLGDEDLYEQQQLFVVVNKETLGSSHGLEHLLHKCSRPSCEQILNDFDSSRRNFFKIPTFFQRNSEVPSLITYSDMSLEESLDVLFSAILEKTPVSGLCGSECGQAISGYLNMDALEDHLEEMVRFELAEYRRELLPLIVNASGETSPGTNGEAKPTYGEIQISFKDTEDEQTDATPVAGSDKAGQDAKKVENVLITFSNGLVLTFQDLVEIGLAKFSYILHKTLDMRVHNLKDPSLLASLGCGDDSPSSSQEGSVEDEDSESMPRIIFRDPEFADFGCEDLSEGAELAVKNLTEGFNGAGHYENDEVDSRFDVSLHVTLTKWSRKPYVRYAAVRAPQIVENFTQQLKTQLSAVYLREKHLQGLLLQTQRVLTALSYMFLVQLESDGTSLVFNTIRESVSSASTESGSSSSAMESDVKDAETEEGAEDKPTPATGDSAISPGTGKALCSQKLRALGGGESVKLRSLLCHDETIITKLTAQFDASSVVKRILCEKSDLLPEFEERCQALVELAREDLRSKMVSVHMAEVHTSLDKLVKILLDRLTLPGGMFGFLKNASYDDESTQCILRDFENNHSVQSVKQNFAQPLQTTQPLQSQSLVQPDLNEKDVEIKKSEQDQKDLFLKDIVDKHRHKLRYAVQERVRMHNEKILTQIVGMFRC